MHMLRAVTARAGLIATAIFGLDVASKWWALGPMALGQRGVEVTPFFNLVLVWNYGISFGMLSEHGDAVRLGLIAVTIAIIVGLCLWLRRVSDRYTASAIGLVLGGAVGNLLDRFRYGAVVDFLDFHWGPYHWPAFNVADSAIVVGVALLAWKSFTEKPAPS